MLGEEAARGEPVLDLVARHTRRDQLSPRDDTVRPGRNPRNHAICPVVYGHCP
jgi:hypothetical protein